MLMPTITRRENKRAGMLDPVKVYHVSLPDYIVRLAETLYQPVNASLARVALRNSQ